MKFFLLLLLPIVARCVDDCMLTLGPGPGGGPALPNVFVGAGETVSVECLCDEMNGTWNDTQNSVGLLMLVNVNLTESGVYVCNGANDTTANFTLNVYEVTLNVTPSSPVLEGSKVTLTCDVQGEGPVNVKNYSFTGNGVPVTTGTSNTYDIANIDDTAEGNYTCSADGVLSTSVAIRSYGIESVEINGNLIVPMGMTLQLNCTAELDMDKPPMGKTETYSWTGPSDFTNSSISIEIANISPNMAGDYTCTASLDSQSVSKTVEVVVQTLMITSPTENDIVFVNSTGRSVECEAVVNSDSVSNITYNWTTLNDSIASTTAVLSLNSSTINSMYTCTAKAVDLGLIDTVTIMVMTQGAPDKVVNITSTLLNLSAVSISWPAPSDNGAPITSYNVTLCINGSNCNVTDAGYERSRMFSDLVASNNYTVSIVAINALGGGEASDSVTFYPPLPPSVLNVINITSQPDTNGSGIVELSWMTPFTDNATFDIMYSVQRGSDSRMDTTSSNSVVLTKLIPSVLNRMSINYNVNIKATYSNGLVSGMESHTFTTGALNVSGLLTVNEAGNAIVGGADMGNTVMLTWPEVQRGTDSLAELYFIGYQVTYNSQGSRGKRATNGDIFTTNNSVTLMDLDFYSNYTYTIAAEYSHMPTNMLLGRVNGPTGTFQTGEGQPEAPEDLIVNDITNNSVRLTWNVPTRTNGIITEYTVTFKTTCTGPTSAPLPEFNVTTDPNLVMTNLSPSSDYEVSVTASTSVGEGRAVTRDFSTSLFVLKAPQVSFSGMEVDANAQVALSIPEIEIVGCDNVKYYVILVEGSSPITPSLVDVSVRAIEGRYYVLDRFDHNDRKELVTVGTGLVSTDTYNPTLQAEKEYRYFVRYMSTRGGKRVNSGFSGVIKVRSPFDSLPIIIAVVVILLILVIIVGIILVVLIIYMRRNPHTDNDHTPFVPMSHKKTKRPYITIEDNMVSSSSGGRTLLYAEVTTDDAEIVWSKDGKNLSGSRFKLMQGGSILIDPTYPDDSGRYIITASNSHGTTDEAVMLKVVQTSPPEADPGHPPIKNEDLIEHVARLRADDSRGFSDEYDSLELDWELTNHHAKAPCNQSKNRFINISPYDHSRVVLETSSEEPGADYINASFLDGYNSPKGYIASQGPTASTLDDFWKMVWQYDSSAIVMVTRLEEGRERAVVKCHQYWPNMVNVPRLYGDIKVTMTEEEEFAFYVIRKFTIQEYGNEEVSREVRHFHFLAWPDHGVPDYATAILAFRQRVRQYHDINKRGPMVVHCSAGVGRTGTFATLDSIIDMMEEEGKLDVFNFVRNLRWKRNYMVQTESQYIFIYDALLEYHSCGDTSVAAANLKKHMNTMETVEEKTSMNGYQTQFEKINVVSPKEEAFDCTEAELSENTSKNRKQRFLPPDDILVEFDDGKGYINATYIDGYRQRKAFVCTQGPLETTLADFWLMIWEQESHAIVMVTELEEKGQEMCVKYWPDEKGQHRQYGRISVMLDSEQTPHADYVSRKLKIWLDDKKDASRSVTQFHFHQWPEGSCPSNASSIVELINDLQRVQRQSGNNPVTVHCSDGVGRTGTFCALLTALDRVKTEQIVDVFRTVKSLRIQRSGMCSIVDEYKFIHEAILEYLTTFEGYSNFT